MGETRYPLGLEKYVRFGYDDYRYGCLCTFPFNYHDHKLSYGTIESLALLGAALCMSVNGGLLEVEYAGRNEYVIPDCIPMWVRDEIRRIMCDYPEKYDEGEYDIDHLSDTTSDSEYKELRIKRLNDIQEWAKQEIKEIENEEDE
ncbi:MULTISPECIES: hypothetical protein [Clostridia]|uniref:hypothetical protein n=1 Tax=Clostridia TaxID=186801 RepID=UPI0012B39D99|nr:hypothetical protein [Clostridium sp. WB02_MRS01]MBW4847617.1 hypothetical protein [Lachnospiraceae bacterium]MSS10577.1 hypothetical protein [Clostridium sp. WB02_MRS01]